MKMNETTSPNHFVIEGETKDEDLFLEKLAESTDFIDNHGRVAPENHIRVAIVYWPRWKNILLKKLPLEALKEANKRNRDKYAKAWENVRQGTECVYPGCNKKAKYANFHALPLCKEHHDLSQWIGICLFSETS